MNANRYIAIRNENCLKCGFCEQYIACAAQHEGCIGCGACISACPQSARSLKLRPALKSTIDFTVDGRAYKTQGPISVKNAILQLGPKFEKRVLFKDGIHAVCETGGCWNCAVLIDGVLTRSCVTPLRSGMEIVTDPETMQHVPPKRIVTLMRPAPHYHPSIFLHGCNYRCDLCHNWDLTFSSSGRALTPQDTVAQLGLNPQKDQWIGISGGEPTLYRKWLVATVRKLREAVPDSHIQLDTNASVLSPEYIDELVKAGVTDLSPDLKAIKLETFMKISGLRNGETAQQYLQNSWQAVRYVNDNYKDQVFMAVSIPCHPKIHSRTELEEMAAALVKINPEIPVTLIELQPAFRIRDWPLLRRKTMEDALTFLEGAGLQRVIIQGGQGIPRAVDPLDLSLSTEEF